MQDNLLAFQVTGKVITAVAKARLQLAVMNTSLTVTSVFEPLASLIILRTWPRGKLVPQHWRCIHTGMGVSDREGIMRSLGWGLDITRYSLRHIKQWPILHSNLVSFCPFVCLQYPASCQIQVLL
jgi:hypothetical protein